MIRNRHFSEELIIYGPFNLDAVHFQGGTISGTEAEMHELGQALLEAMGRRSTSQRGKWQVEVVPHAHELEPSNDFYTEGDVCIVYDDRLEWVLEFREAWLMAEDYAQVQLENVQDEKERNRLFDLYDQADKAQRLDVNDKDFVKIREECAHDLLEICNVEDIDIRGCGTLADVVQRNWEFFEDIHLDLVAAVSAWLEEHEVTETGWCDHFLELVLDQSFEDARRNREQFERRCISFDSLEELRNEIESFLGMECRSMQRGEKQFVTCISPTGMIAAEFAVRGEPGTWFLGGPTTEALSSVELFQNKARDRHRRLQRRDSKISSKALHELVEYRRQATDERLRDDAN